MSLPDYPFAPHYAELPRGRMHYVDHGPTAGPLVLFVHGNPTWSFFFRQVVRELGDTFRCIAPDHLGCGLSAKPADHPYDLASRIDDLAALVATLPPGPLRLVAHDWGGAIACGLALRMPHRIAGMVLYNTAAFPFPTIPWRIAACRIPVLGRLMVCGLNAFAVAATRMTTVRPLPAAVRHGYLLPYNSWRNRIAVWRFVMDIPMRASHPSFATLAAIGDQLPSLSHIPRTLIWGDADWCFHLGILAEWQRRWPDATVHRLPNTGHYLTEDNPELVAQLTRASL
jgi:cis-3-alkyl-4-acyloxetan-2-one decarboxylase